MVIASLRYPFLFLSDLIELVASCTRRVHSNVHVLCVAVALQIDSTGSQTGHSRYHIIVCSQLTLGCHTVVQRSFELWAT
jgi:hypothetical protein